MVFAAFFELEPFFSMEFAPFWCSNFSWIRFGIKVCLGSISSLFLDSLGVGFKCSQWISVVLQSSFNVDSGVYLLNHFQTCASDNQTGDATVLNWGSSRSRLGCGSAVCWWCPGW